MNVKRILIFTLIYLFSFSITLFNKNQIYGKEINSDFDCYSEYNVSLPIKYCVIRQGGVILYDYANDSISYGIIVDGYQFLSNTPQPWIFLPMHKLLKLIQTR